MEEMQINQTQVELMKAYVAKVKEVDKLYQDTKEFNEDRFKELQDLRQKMDNYILGLRLEHDLQEAAADCPEPPHFGQV